MRWRGGHAKLSWSPENAVWGQAAEVKFAFAYRSVCDRIAFARWKSSNRTAHLPSRENGRAPCFLIWGDTFSESGLSAKYAELRAFSEIFKGKRQSFSAVETAWRRELDSNSRYRFALSPKAPFFSNLPGFHPRNEAQRKNELGSAMRSSSPLSVAIQRRRISDHWAIGRCG